MRFGLAARIFIIALMRSLRRILSTGVSLLYRWSNANPDAPESSGNRMEMVRLFRAHRSKSGKIKNPAMPESYYSTNLRMMEEGKIKKFGFCAYARNHPPKEYHHGQNRQNCMRKGQKSAAFRCKMAKITRKAGKKSAPSCIFGREIVYLYSDKKKEVVHL